MGWWLPNPHTVPTTGQAQSLPQGPGRDVEGEGEKERFRGPEKERWRDAKEKHMTKRKR